MAESGSVRIGRKEDGGIPLSRGGEGRRARYKMLALDVDGTLLDRDGALRPSTAEAVARAARAGIRPVLCTGRRYRRARPVAEQLGLDAPIVCNSGAIVKEPAGHGTLWRADFDAPLLAEILAVFRDHDEPVVSFTDLHPDEPDFLVEHHRDRPPAVRRLPRPEPRARRGRARLDRARARRRRAGHFHLCAIGTRPAMLDFERAVLDRLGGRVRTFVQRSPRYAGTMCEVIRHDASKWAAVLHLAELWGVAPGGDLRRGRRHERPADDRRRRASAWRWATPPTRVRAAADHVTGDHDEDGVAMLVDEVLLALELRSDRSSMNNRQDESDPPPSPSWVREAEGAADTTIEENWLFRLRRERFRSRTSGKVHDYFVMHLADAVNVIALTPDDQVVLVRQFRAGSARDSLEPPGGLLDPGEDPCAAGARELLEETGYAGDAAVLLGSVWSNPSILSSRICRGDGRQRPPRGGAEARRAGGALPGGRPRAVDPADDPRGVDRPRAVRDVALVVAG